MRKNKEISYDVAENRKRKHVRIAKEGVPDGQISYKLK